MLTKIEKNAIENLVRNGIKDHIEIMNELAIKTRKAEFVKQYLDELNPKKKKKRQFTQFIHRTGGNSKGVTVMTPNQSQMSDDLKPARKKSGKKNYIKKIFDDEDTN